MSVSALPLAMNGLLSPGAAAAPPDGERIVLHGAVVDDRYAEGREFAAALAASGVPAESLRDGDVTGAYLALDRLWRERRAAIAGLTQFGPMLVIERLGRERGLRMTLRVEHRVRGDGALSHVLSGAPETLALAEPLRHAAADWPVLIAALAASCRAGCAASAERTIATSACKPEMRRAAGAVEAREPETVIHYYRQFALQEGRAIPWDGPLFSWVMAPRGGA